MTRIMFSDYSRLWTPLIYLFNRMQIKSLQQYKSKETINILKSMPHIFTRPNESFMILSFINGTKHIKGEIAEVGIYKGDTSQMIAKIKGNKELYLFDVFEEEMPLISNKDKELRKNIFQCSYEKVVDKFKEYNGVFIHKGIFPQETGHFIKNKIFSFVNIDVDTYLGTKMTLEFLYDKVSGGGGDFDT